MPKTGGVIARGAALLLCAILTAHPAWARNDLLDAINALRQQGCDGRSTASAPLRTEGKLTEAAQRFSKGTPLNQALMSVGYSAEQSSSIHIATNGGDRIAARLLQAHFCAEVSERAFREIGISHQGDQIWIVFAAPLRAPAAQDAATVNRRILELINDARAHPRQCGRKRFTPAPPLMLSAMLEQAALEHSRDMALHDYFEHRGGDGSTPADRAKRAGYRFVLVGENIAAGVATPEEAVSGWLASPAHCENVMEPRFTEMGIGYAVNARSRSVVFWTQVFAVPRNDFGHGR